MSSAARSSRVILRSAARPSRSLPRRQVRFNSSSSSSVNQPPAGNGLPHGVVGGVVGASAVLLAGYGYYHYSGAKTIVDQAHAIKSYLRKTADSVSKNTPEPNEAIESLKKFASSYAVFIPGGKAFVDTTFKDLDTVRAKHGEEVDKIVKDTYTQVQGLVKKDGFSLEAAAKAWDVLSTQLSKITSLASDAFEDIIDNHPDLKNKVGGSLTQLKEYGEKYGPQAKEKVDKVYSQIKDVLKTGLTTENISKIQKIIQENVDSMQDLGQEAFKKGMERAQPLLDKAPEVKKLLDKNLKDLMRKADWQELYGKIQESVKSGKVEPVQKYVESVLDKTEDKSGDKKSDDKKSKKAGDEESKGKK